MLAFVTATEVLEIPDSVHQEAWQQNQRITPLGHRWQVYLNQICLQTVMPWLRKKSGLELSLDAECSTAVWERVNGSAVRLGNQRIVLIPIEDCDRSEFRIPQEWVDIPDWVGDYYFAIEVDADEQLVYLWAYTMHQLIKTQGQYDAEDRSYTLTGNHLIQDMTVFWIMQQLESEPTRVPVQSLPHLSDAQIESLMPRLEQAVMPRLEIPFTLWGAFLQQHRLVEPRSRPAADANLSQWLNQIFELGWQPLEAFLSATPELGFKLRQDETQSMVRRVKPLQLEDVVTVLLVVTVEEETDDRRRIWVKLLPQGSKMPENVQLSLISEAGEMLQSVQSSHESDYIQLKRFRCEASTPFQIEVSGGTTRIVEAFVS